MDEYNRQVLVTRMVSQASAAQRKGRAGRTCPGECLRLCTEAEYKKLEPFEENEIHRMDCFSLVLDFFAAEFSVQMIIRVLDTLDKSRVLDAVGRLQRNGLIEKTKDTEAKKSEQKEDFWIVTERGQFVSKIPVCPELGCVLFHAHKAKLSPETLYMLVVSMAYVETSWGASLFWVPTKHQATPEQSNELVREMCTGKPGLFESSLKALYLIPIRKPRPGMNQRRQLSKAEHDKYKKLFIRKYHEQFRGHSDVETFLKVHAAYVHRDQEKLKTRNAFTRTFSLNNKTLGLVDALIKQIVLRCQDLKIVVAAAASYPKALSADVLQTIHYLFFRGFGSENLLSCKRTWRETLFVHVKWASRQGIRYHVADSTTFSKCLSMEDTQGDVEDALLPDHILALSMVRGYVCACVCACVRVSMSVSVDINWCGHAFSYPHTPPTHTHTHILVALFHHQPHAEVQSRHYRGA
jgi:HrpA-like RNA helicase